MKLDAFYLNTPRITLLIGILASFHRPGSSIINLVFGKKQNVRKL